MTRFALVAFLISAACTTEAALDQPPFGDSQRIGGTSSEGKADGASPITVRARTSGYRSADEYIGPDGFVPGTNCYDTWYDVEVTYANTSLPWGTSLELVSAMQGVEWAPDLNNVYYYEYFDWKYEERAAAPSVGPWQWRAVRGQLNPAGGGSFSAVHFAIRIRYPDGTIRWDNGGSAWGYHEVKLPTAPCEMAWTPYVSTTPTEWTAVDATIVHKW